MKLKSLRSQVLEPSKIWSKIDLKIPNKLDIVNQLRDPIWFTVGRMYGLTRRDVSVRTWNQ